MTRIRRSSQSYLYYLGLIGICVYLMVVVSTGMWIYMYIIYMVLLLTVLGRCLWFRNCIVVENGKGIIYDGLRTKRFLQAEIDHITMHSNLFTQAYFQLKSGKKIYFNGWNISEKELKKLEHICPKIK